MTSVSSIWVVVLTCGFSSVSAAAVDEVAEAPNVSELALVTGLHRVTHKGSGFDVRLLEADGSTSVAWDPVSLFLVVTNNATSDGIYRIWRLPRGVERVRDMLPGVDVGVDVDRVEDTGVAGWTRRPYICASWLRIGRCARYVLLGGGA